MGGEVVSITDREFPRAVFESELPVLVDFWAPWCGACRRMEPVLEELAEEYEGRLRIAKVDTEENEVQAGEYGVQGIPTMILFRRGNEVDRVVGVVPKLVLQLWLEDSISGTSVDRLSDIVRRSA